MDLEVFLYALTTILSFGGLIGLALGFQGEYKDSKTPEDKRGVRNKYIVLGVVAVFIIAAVFIFLGTYLIPILT